VIAAMLWLAAQPIALHPDNPRYFLWRGKPTVLITSAEHYGAVDRREAVDHVGGERALESPKFAQDAALRIVRR
jgi:hypothetical protein